MKTKNVLLLEISHTLTPTSLLILNQTKVSRMDINHRIFNLYRVEVDEVYWKPKMRVSNANYIVEFESWQMMSSSDVKR